MTFATFTIDQLCVSPLNARRNDDDANDTEWLEASILTGGLIYPLVVHSMKGIDAYWPEGSKAPWGAVDGGRRCRAIHRLVERGDLPSDYPVQCSVQEDLSEAELIELSLITVLTPRGFHAWEVDAGIVRAHQAGHSVGDLVRETGQTELWVRQRIRLGRLAPEIFESYAAGEISIELAEAYAATEDVELQLAAWQHFQGEGTYQHTDRAVRGFLKVDDREEAALLRFVGEDVYRAAGGCFELDLFADGPERGRVVDPAKLRELTENKLGDLRQRIRRRTGRSDLQFLSEVPKTKIGTIDRTLAIDVPPVDLATSDAFEIPDGNVACSITISQFDNSAGEPEVEFWWATAKAKREARSAGSEQATSKPISVLGHEVVGSEAMERDEAGSQYAAAARAAVKEEHGLTSDGLQVARALRRAALRAVLVEDAANGGTLGRDYAIWSALRQELTNDRWAQLGARGLVDEWHVGGDREPTDKVAPSLDATEAQQRWKAAVDRIAREPFIAIEDPDEAFAAWLDALEPVRNLAAAVLAGIAMVRSANVPGWRVSAHDRLAALAGATPELLHDLVGPDEHFIGMLPKMKRLELAHPFVGQQQTAEWSKLKDREITAAVTGALRDAPAWVHPVVGFEPAMEREAEAVDG